ncbi:MAG: AAA family ATPase [Gammaproteobacteria bacterium]|nr:AAA family ATPase [Gammaproteobacteria bacterium]
MKIEICGYSGSGKSTLAKELSKLYNLPILHLDKVNFKENWKERDKEEMTRLIREFLSENESWVIDGSYFNRAKERFELADYIIIMKFNPFVSGYRVIKRNKQYKNTQRDDIASGCIGGFNLSFFFWVILGSRMPKRNKHFKWLKENYKEKLIYLNNQRQVDKFLKRVQNGGDIKETK